MKTKVRAVYTLSKLDELFDQNPNFTLIYNDSEVKEFCEILSIPKEYREDITAFFLEIANGEIGLVFASESNSPESLSSHYRILPFYRSKVSKYFPYYWKRNNYSKKNIYNAVKDFMWKEDDFDTRKEYYQYKKNLFCS